uniref:BOS complex subunit NCLN n=2 Tax=Babesia bovis TaxID=5865 RepID=A7AR99_BABBO|eukprot:XP_001610636.1 hypothetical protein [Babesia bovis T2Bo]
MGNARQAFPDLLDASGKMSDVELETALGQRLQKNAFGLMLHLNDILKDRFDFLTLRALLKTIGGVVTIVVPPPDKIEPGSPSGCTECPTLENVSGTKKPVCKHDPSRFHQSTMDAFNAFLQGYSSKAVVSIVEESDSASSVMKHYASSDPDGSTVNRYRLVSVGPKKISSFRSLNVHGILKDHNDVATSKDTGGKGEQRDSTKNPNTVPKPKIVIASHVDTFSLLQGYRSTATNNTGLIALLELSRLLHGLDHMDYELIFLLTTGSVMNFYGAATFANNYAHIDNVELVICLDDLTGPNLYLHSSSKASEISSVFQRNLSRTVKETLNNAVKPDAQVLFFEHEQFTRQKVHAITLTTVRESVAYPLRQNLFEYKCNSKALSGHIANIFRALAKTLRIGKVKVDSVDIANHVIDWESKLTSPRCTLNGDIYQDESVRAIIRFLTPLIKDLKTQKVNRSIPGFEFSYNTPMRILFYKNYTMLYHILVVVCSVVYIFVMWSLIRGSPLTAWTDIIATLNKVPSVPGEENSENRRSTRLSSKRK